MTINSKNHIPLSARLMRKLDLNPGSKIKLFVDLDGSKLVMMKATSIMDAFGILPKPVKSYTIEEMDRAVQNSVPSCPNRKIVSDKTSTL